jgi:FkbM family methyltransferase
MLSVVFGLTVLADLIYDVGLHDGRDTRHYLDCGFRVVAVEANPALVAAARQEFAEEIASGRLVIVGAAIASKEGMAPFWVNESVTEWSSLDEAEGAREGTRAHAVIVDSVTLGSLVEEYGVPYYLKIDIEGASKDCLLAISSADLPAYVSVEAHTAAYLGLLNMLGYDEFKLIDQRSHRAVAGYEPPRIRRWRRYSGVVASPARSAARRLPGARRAYRTVVRTPPPAEASAALSTFGTSGPFAEDTDGEWRSMDDVALDFLLLRSSDTSSWCDFHARRRP